MSRTWTFSPSSTEKPRREMKIRQESRASERKRSLRKFRRAKQQKPKTENWVENGTRIKGSWRRRWCRVGDVAFNSAVTFFGLSWFLRPSQLVEEEKKNNSTTEDKKRRRRRIILLSVTANQLDRVDSLPMLFGFRAFCSSYFWRKNSKKLKKSKRNKREQMTRMAVSCRARLHGYFRSKQLLGEWTDGQLGE